MPTLELKGIGSVQVGEDFKSLSADDQEKTINEIATHLRGGQQPAAPQDSSWSRAITGVPEEAIRTTKELAGSAMENLKGAFTHVEHPPGEGFLEGYGREIASAPGKAAQFFGGVGKMAGVPFAPFYGAGKSLLGRPLAQAVHKTGELIAPETAAKQSPEDVYQLMREDVGTALTGTMPARVPAPKVSVPTKDELFGAANEAYSKARRLDVAMEPASTRTLANNIKQTLDLEGFKDYTTPGTFRIIDQLKEPKTKMKMTAEATTPPPPEQGTIRLYRGETPGGSPAHPGSNMTGGWFTTDLEKAKLYGEVKYVDVPRNKMGNFAQGHGGKDEFVTDSKLIMNSTKPYETPGATSTEIVAHLNDVLGVRQVLNRLGGNQNEKAAANIAIKKIDTYIGNLVEERPAIFGDQGPEAARLIGKGGEGPGNYAAAKRTEMLDKARDRADLNAASAGSGANVDNALRQQAKSILISDKKTRGLSNEEIAQLHQIVDGTFAGNTARLFGKLAPTGIVSAGMSGGAGFAAGGAPGALATMGLGFSAKKLSDFMTKSQFNKLDMMVRQRSPLGERMQAPLKKWVEAGQQFAISPTMPSFVKFQLAGTNLANNLKDIGIRINPADLIRTLQGPVPVPAETEQQ